MIISSLLTIVHYVISMSSRLAVNHGLNISGECWCLMGCVSLRVLSVVKSFMSRFIPNNTYFLTLTSHGAFKTNISMLYDAYRTQDHPVAL